MILQETENLLLNRPPPCRWCVCNGASEAGLSRKLLRGDKALGGGGWLKVGAKRPLSTTPKKSLRFVISTKKRSKASFAGRNLFHKVISSLCLNFLGEASK